MAIKFVSSEVIMVKKRIMFEMDGKNFIVNLTKKHDNPWNLVFIDESDFRFSQLPDLRRLIYSKNIIEQDDDIVILFRYNTFFVNKEGIFDLPQRSFT